MTIIMFYHYSHYHVLNIIINFTTIVIMIVLPCWCCFRRIIVDVQKIITIVKHAGDYVFIHNKYGYYWSFYPVVITILNFMITNCNT